MKILCPMSPNIYENFDQIIENGADEFYMGYLMKGARFGHNLSRRTGSRPNFDSLETTIEAIRSIKRKNKKAFITFNQKFYLKEHHEHILKDTERLIEEGIDGVIVSDMNLMMLLKEKFPDMTMISSTVRVVTNSSSIEFFKNLGISKFVLSGALKIDEINDIITKNEDVGFEIFIKNERCPNIDGLCSLSHEAIKTIPKTPCLGLSCDHHIDSSKRFNEYACGVCSIYDIRRSEGISLKISGRPKSGEEVSKDVMFVKKSLEFLDSDRMFEREEFILFVKDLFRKIYGTDCKENCYYIGRY
ncbi:MAG: peptidase U32 family protein [Candidatus Woesearchaeota archaeon]